MSKRKKKATLATESRLIAMLAVAALAIGAVLWLAG